MNKYKLAFSKISKLLGSDFENSQPLMYKTVFKEIKSVVKYDFGFIFYLNEKNLQLKYQTKKVLKSETIDFEEHCKEILFNEKTISSKDANSILKPLNSNNKDNKFLVSKLSIRKTVFGILVLIREGEKTFDKEEHEIVKELCTIISYSIKDFELSEIFKIQLKALQETVLEKYDAYKTQNDFITNMSHELRTPLNSIIGLSESLDSKIFGELNPKQTEYVEDIRTSALHLLTMINDILDLSKLESSTVQLKESSFELDKAILEVLNIIKPLAQKKNIKLLFENTNQLAIKADHQKIQQILYNLLSNAIKFTPKNGEITVSTTKIKKTLCIKIKDNGIGIAKKDQLKIFEKFIQVKTGYTKNESSTGLGLTITKQLVEMHRGQISVKSEPDKGSEFTVTLPA